MSLLASGDKEQAEIDIALAGRRTWDERYRNEKQQNRFLRILVAGLVAALLLVLLAFLDVNHKQGIVRPSMYVVETNTGGRLLAVHLLNPARDNFAPSKVVRGMVTQFVEDWRSVTTDLIAQKYALVDPVYAHIPKSSQAAADIDKWYLSNDPRTRSQEERVQAVVINALPESDTTWEVHWKEIHIPLNSSGEQHTQYLRTKIAISIRPWTDKEAKDPDNAAAIQANPFGLWIEHIYEPQPDNS